MYPTESDMGMPKHACKFKTTVSTKLSSILLLSLNLLTRKRNFQALLFGCPKHYSLCFAEVFKQKRSKTHYSLMSFDSIY